MKKNYKIILLLVFAFLLSGCTADFEITVGNDIQENLTIYSDSTSEFNKLLQTQHSYPINKYYNDQNIEAYVTGYQPNVSYYDFYENDKSNTLQYNSTFTIRKAPQSNIINECFEEYEVRSSKDELYLSTNEGFQCFKNGLKSVTVTLKTKYKVMYSNADTTNGNDQIWYIDSSNYSKKMLRVNLYTKTPSDSSSSTDTKTPSNNTKDNQTNKGNNTITEENSNLLTIVIFCILGIILLIAIVVLIQKKMNNDRL